MTFSESSVTIDNLLTDTKQLVFLKNKTKLFSLSYMKNYQNQQNYCMNEN